MPPPPQKGVYPASFGPLKRADNLILVSGHVHGGKKGPDFSTVGESRLESRLRNCALIHKILKLLQSAHAPSRWPQITCKHLPRVSRTAWRPLEPLFGGKRCCRGPPKDRTTLVQNRQNGVQNQQMAKIQPLRTTFWTLTARARRVQAQNGLLKRVSGGLRRAFETWHRFYY